MIEDKLHDYENLIELVNILTDVFNFLSDIIV